MKRVNVCSECNEFTVHLHWCQSRGYGQVGPHPDAEPMAETQRSPTFTPCPCGIDKRDCEYHR